MPPDLRCRLDLRHLVCVFAAVLRIDAAVMAAEPAAALYDQSLADRADGPKTIIDLQQYRRSQTIGLSAPGAAAGEATLVNLAPAINAWFLLTLERGDGTGIETYHLQNPRPYQRRLALDPDRPHGIEIRDGSERQVCDLWSGAPDALAEAQASGLPFAPLCDGRLYLRNQVAGRRTHLERTVEFLRDHVWGGETLVGFVRDGLFRDAFLERGAAGPAADLEQLPAGGPQPASVSPAHAGRSVVPEHLGIRVAASNGLAPGRWYRMPDIPGVHLSVIRPGAVASDILNSRPERASAPDPVEASALVYLVAFDLGQLDLGFALGTDHPRVGWSPRPPKAVRPAGLPGPDGIDDTAPLVTLGMVSPKDAGRTVATFAGGFKREHGAFKYGDLAGREHGSHYGFIEEGVVFSTLRPDLATLFVLDDGSVHMKSWTASDERLLPRIRYARQNGVPLVEPDPASGLPIPGPLVAHWGPGNWSGSAEGKLRTLRAGACLQESEAGRFLIYGYFSTATPSAMARVFQAYGCAYAMHLDMNALEHTYFALYLREADEIVVQHLVRGMTEVDKEVEGELAPRFLGFPDNRDVFYLMRREDRP